MSACGCQHAGPGSTVQPAHTNCFWQVEAYANQMEPILDALKYLTPYGFDVLTYIILARLTLDRAKVRVRMGCCVAATYLTYIIRARLTLDHAKVCVRMGCCVAGAAHAGALEECVCVCVCASGVCVCLTVCAWCACLCCCPR